MQFAQTIADFLKRAQALPDAVARNIVIETARQMIDLSPVLTGAFRGNWHGSVGDPVTDFDKTVTDKDSDTTLAAIIAAVAAWKASEGSTFYLANGAPYARRLEYGYSAKAPSGMVRVTLAAFDSIVDKAVSAAEGQI